MNLDELMRTCWKPAANPVTPRQPDLLLPFEPVKAVRHTVRVEFDGGTPCNIPAQGYGIGYGSYRIDQQRIVRVNFGIPMSANVAEISTLLRALESVKKSYDPAHTKVFIAGDSQIALNRCTNPLKKKDKEGRRNPAFVEAVDKLISTCAEFAEVQTFWRGRAASVALFGH